MPLLIIEPNYTTKEAHEWLQDVFVQILDAIELDEPATWAYYVEKLSYADVDAIFERAMKGLVE